MSVTAIMRTWRDEITKPVYRSCKDLVQDVPVCPTCHFPVGRGGWMRRDLPVTHPDFGRPVPCPACNSGKAQPPF